VAAMAIRMPDFSESRSRLPTRPVDLADAVFCRAAVLSITLIAVVYFALFGFLLFRTAIVSPISDMFTYIDDYLRFRSGEMSLAGYLWKAHGEHHLVWIRLLTWADVEIFHTRGIPFMAAASVAIAGTAVLIWRELRTAMPDIAGATCLALLAPMLLLSAANVTDCSVPINTTYPFTVFFIVLALVLFVDPQAHSSNVDNRRLAAMLAAIGASMGTAGGLLAWPILLWIAWRERLGPVWLITLTGAGIAYCLFYVQGIYFLGFSSASAKDAATFVGVAHLYKLLDYFFAFLGLPFTREPELGLIGPAMGGLVFLVGSAALLFATCSNRMSTRLDRIAIGMILLGFGAAVLAAVGRGDMSDEVKVPVRYTIFVSALQVGVLCILLPRTVRHFGVGRARIFQCSACVVFAAILLILQIFIGRSAAKIADNISRDADCFAGAQQRGPVSSIVTRWPADAESVLMALRQQGLLAPRRLDCVASSQN
jgi:hypothetical protein